MTQRRLTREQRKAVDHFNGEVLAITDFFRETGCIRDPKMVAIPQNIDGFQYKLHFEPVEHAYLQIRNLFPGDSILIDFIEGEQPFVADNYHHALACILYTLSLEKSGGSVIFTNGFSELMERTRKECHERSRKKSNSEIKFHEHLKRIILGDFWEQIELQIEEGTAPEPRTQDYIVKVLLFDEFDQSRVSRAMRNIKIFRSQKGYEAWFRDKLDMGPRHSSGKDEKGKSMPFEHPTYDSYADDLESDEDFGSQDEDEHDDD